MGRTSPHATARRSAATTALVVSLLCLVAPCSAQLGVKVGVAASGYRATHTDERVWTGEDYRPFLGYEVDRLQGGQGYPALDLQLGVTYARRIWNRLAVQPEFHLAFRGVRWDQVELYDEAYELDVAYLQVPLLLRVAGPSRWSVRPSLLAGPYVSLKLNAARALTLQGRRDTKDLDNMRSLDYGLVFAVENAFSAWSRELQLEVRAEWGLGSCFEPLPGSTPLHLDPGRVNLVALTVLAGYRFGT
jgi:hypothetical protein